MANDPRRRLEEQTRRWRVTVERMVETEGSLLAFGHRSRQPIVLKVIRSPGCEWSSGRVLEAFGGRGVVRALDHGDGAVLLERLLPGNRLVDASELDDEAATGILADVIGRMSPARPPDGTPTVESWSVDFERYATRGTSEIPESLVDAARRHHAELCASASATRLLHGDLHHHNVLFDLRRGWLAIDPKGVVGELACEVGAALRNPCERPERFVSRPIIEKRVDRFVRQLGLDAERVLGWAFAGAVLAAIWEIEDAGVVKAGAGWITLANAIRPMLRAPASGGRTVSR